MSPCTNSHLSLQIIYIVIGIVSVIILGLIIVLAMHCRERRAARRRQLIEQTNHVILKPKNTDNHNIYKRNSKMSNLEASQVNIPEFVVFSTFTTFISTLQKYLLCACICVFITVWISLGNYQTKMFR